MKIIRASGQVFAHVLVLASVASAATLKPGDVLVSTSSEGGRIYRIDPATGHRTTFASVSIQGIQGIDISPAGEVYFVTSATAFTLDSAGGVHVVADGFIHARDIAASADGGLFVADEWDPEHGPNYVRVNSIDVATGTWDSLTTYNGHVAGIGISPEGDVIVGSTNGEIHRVNAVTGARERIAVPHPNLNGLDVAPSGNIYAARDGRAWQIDPATGAVTTICDQGDFGLADIAAGENDSVYCVQTRYGRMRRWDEPTGTWPLVASGLGYQNHLAVFAPESAPYIIPEPLSIFSGLIGLGMVAAYLQRRRRPLSQRRG